jgi:hypothetical protein
MAINGPLTLLDLNGRADSAIGPASAKVERRLLYHGVTPLEINVARFDYDEAAGVPDPQIVWAMPLPYAYADGQGLSLQFIYATETIATGATVWEVAFCVARMSQAGEVFQELDWGTPAESAVDLVPSVAGQFKEVLLGAAESDFGFAGSNTTDGSTAQMLFIRLRRKNTSASDTLRAPALLFGVELLEGV